MNLTTGLIFPGWRLIPYDAHVRISIVMEDVMIENTEVKTNVQILKDKAGKELVKKQLINHS